MALNEMSLKVQTVLDIMFYLNHYSIGTINLMIPPLD